MYHRAEAFASRERAERRFLYVKGEIKKRELDYMLGVIVGVCVNTRQPAYMVIVGAGPLDHDVLYGQSFLGKRVTTGKPVVLPISVWDDLEAWRADYYESGGDLQYKSGYAHAQKWPDAVRVIMESRDVLA